MVSIDIAGFDPEATRRREKPNRLPPGYGELKLNPVVNSAETVCPGLNAGQIRMHIPVKSAIANCAHGPIGNAPL